MHTLVCCTQMTVQWCLVRGIARLMAALRRGLERVLALDRLSCFSPSELRLVLCGEQSPQWTRDELLRFIHSPFLVVTAQLCI